MDQWVPIVASIVEVALAGMLILMLPRLTRRGLLFGVYVGDETAFAREAARIKRSWYRGMGLTILACLIVGGAFVLTGRPVAALAAPDAILLAGLGWNYYRAYSSARALGASRAQPAPPPAAAALSPSQPSLGLPLLATVLAAAVGAAVLWYAWSNYGALPDSVPTHFSGGGRPDAWSDKSFASVMTLPLSTLLTGVAVGVLACFMARSKRALRLKDKGVSLVAQERFRTAIVVFLSVETLLLTAMLATMSVDEIRVGLGRAEGLSWLVLYTTVALLLFTIGGTVYIAVRYGQGGARLERSAAEAPLTDGLADNTKWKLGTIYVNRDDPAMFVEHRFGLGYTVNFGNPKAVVFLVIFFALVVALPLLLAVSM